MVDDWLDFFKAYVGADIRTTMHKVLTQTNIQRKGTLSALEPQKCQFLS